MGSVKGSPTALGEFIRFGFECAVGVNAKVVVRKQPVELRDVISDLGLAPLQFKPFEFLGGPS